MAEHIFGVLFGIGSLGSFALVLLIYLGVLPERFRKHHTAGGMNRSKGTPIYYIPRDKRLFVGALVAYLVLTPLSAWLCSSNQAPAPVPIATNMGAIASSADPDPCDPSLQNKPSSNRRAIQQLCIFRDTDFAWARDQVMTPQMRTEHEEDYAQNIEQYLSDPPYQSYERAFAKLHDSLDKPNRDDREVTDAINEEMGLLTNFIREMESQEMESQQ
jgi:hypothetical protein